jgi:hypothetical protein
MAVKAFVYNAVAVGGSGAESGARTFISLRNSTTPAVGYSNSGLTTPVANPQIADGDGRCGPIYVDDAVDVTFTVKTANLATTLLTVDLVDGVFGATYLQIDQLTFAEPDAVGDGAETEFDLTGVEVSSTYQLLVTIDGILQPAASYDVSTDGTDSTVTFSQAPPSGSLIYFRTFTFQGLQGVAGNFADIDAFTTLTNGTGAEVHGVRQGATNRKATTNNLMVMASGSTVARSLATRFTDEVWLADHISDFAAANNTTGFQAALTAASGKTLRVPANVTVWINTSALPAAIRIKGEGPSSVIKLRASNDDNLLESSAGSFLCLEDLTLDGNKANNATGAGFSGNCLHTASTDKIVCRNVIFQNGDENGVRQEGGSDVLFEFCQFNDNGANGHYPVYGSAGEDIARVTLIGCRAYNNGYKNTPSQFFEGFSVDPESTQCRYIACHAELNNGLGFNVFGFSPDTKDVQYVNCTSAANVFGGFGRESGQGIQYVNCISRGDGTGHATLDADYTAAFTSVDDGTGSPSDTTAPDLVTYTGCKAISPGGRGFSFQGRTADTVRAAKMVGCVVYNPGSGFAGITAEHITSLRLTGCEVIDDRGSPLMTYAVNVASTGAGVVIEGGRFDAGSSGTINSAASDTRYSYVDSASGTLITNAPFANTGLKIKDTNASHNLTLAPGSNITADRTLTVTTGDQNVTLNLSGASSWTLGTAAIRNTGQSGTAVPLCDAGTTTWTAGASDVSNVYSADAGYAKYIRGATAGSVRNDLALATSESESGANAGSNFRLTCFTDAAGFIGFGLKVRRADLGVELPGVYNLTSASAANVFVDSSGNLVRSTSSLKYKREVEPADPARMDSLLAAAEKAAIWYRSKCANDNPNWGHYGLSAEALVAAAPQFVQFRTHTIRTWEEDGLDAKGEPIKTQHSEAIPLDTPEPEGVAYDRFVVPLIWKVVEMTRRLEALERGR